VVVRSTFYDLLRRLAASSDLRDPIVEFGAARAVGQTHRPTVKSMFPGRFFTGSDMNLGPGVDQVQDLCHLGLRDESVGTAIMLDTLEHVEEPRAAMSELRRCLARDGVLVLTTVFYFPIHKLPSDYRRYTADGMRAELRDFERSFVGEAGLRLFPHTVVGLAGGPDVSEERWLRLCDVIEQWLLRGATSWKERLSDLLPPILLQRVYEIYTRGTARPDRQRERRFGTSYTRGTARPDRRVGRVATVQDPNPAEPVRH
jgi:SAM-dependent methyltransferase